MFEERAMPPTRADAIKRICEDLGLPAGDAFTQDWEQELPDEFRTSDWMKRLLGSYNSEGYGSLEKQVIMSVLLDCLNDGVEAGDEAIERLWSDVAHLLSADRDIHSDLIEHWSLPGEPIEDAFAITARLRGLTS